MADDAEALSESTPPPAANPDAQTTVNDFLDYTEFFPSDLVRSLRLISDLDSTYHDATQQVHELTVKYGSLPSIPANERPDPVALRKSIAAALNKAIYCRESTFAEASRLYEVAERHCHRIAIIKRKLQALPQPPSRDPTPAPVSPQASRSLHRGFDRTPHLRLTFDGGRGHGAARPRDRSKKSTVRLHGAIARSPSSSDISDAESDVRSTIDVAISPKKLKLSKEKTPKPPKARIRVPGSGTNVHSSIAGISTSNALAKLSPPPPDAKPGSKWAPWFKLTEYEMAVLRKQMKKNAVWTPSETMIRRELDRKQRGQAYYDKEKARCEATGEEFLDEEPVVPSFKAVALPAAAPIPASAPASTPTPAPVSASTAPPVPTPVLGPGPAPPLASAPAPLEAPPVLGPSPPPVDERVDSEPALAEPPKEILKEDSVLINKGKHLSDVKEAKKVRRESLRQQAMRDAQELEDATRKIKEAADSLKELNFSTPTSRRKSIARASNKRKRDASPQPTAVATESPAVPTREPSLASQDSGTKPPESKRLRILPPLAPAPAPPTAVSSPQASTPSPPSPIVNTPVPLPETTKTTTIQVPLAPAGPSTPKATFKPYSRASSRQATPVIPSPTVTTPEPQESSSASPPPPPPPPPVPQPTVTAASTRSRRESVAPRATSPPLVPGQANKLRKTPTPGPEPALPSPVLPNRPRSARGHVPTPKAQSEEPKPHELAKSSRELRRHSIFSQSAITAPTRMSTRKKPPPKGDITAGEDGQKTVTNVKRAQGNKNKKKKKADEESEPPEDIDPNEPRYCICDDVSYGQMIQCDNNCEREWFHLECVNMTEKDIPSRRAKWYCPDCRAALDTDMYGNPRVAPPLPGRRGNR